MRRPARGPGSVQGLLTWRGRGRVLAALSGRCGPARFGCAA